MDRYRGFRITFSLTLWVMTATTGPFSPVIAEGKYFNGVFLGVFRRGKESRWSDE